MSFQGKDLILKTPSIINENIYENAFDTQWKSLDDMGVGT